MSDELTHINVGDIMGKAIAKCGKSKITKAVIASILGFFSHAVLDVVDNDYTINATSYETLKQDADYLAVQISGIGLKLYDILINEKDEERKITRLAGVLGAVSPDIIDGVYSYLHPEKWQKGELLFPFHRAGTSIGDMQTKEQSMAKSGLITLISFKIKF